MASAGRVLVVNRLPIASRGRPIGSVTTLRDRTELLELRRELDLTRHVTDTLRAQAHEFSNRLHTIAGLIELGEAEEAVRFVHRVSSSRSEFSEAVTAAVRDPSVAALLIAKASQAAELGVDLRIAPESSLPVLDDELSTDVATVVGNLVDNAMDAAAEAPAAVGRGVARAGRRRGRRRRPRLRARGAAGHGAGDLPPRGLHQGPRDGPGATGRGSAASACRWCTWCAPAAAATSRSSSVGGSTFTATLPAEPSLVTS